MATQNPYCLLCNRCNLPFSIDGKVPIQSRTCEHSVCAVCIESVRHEKRSNGASGDELIPCHECHAENAFHLTDYKDMANALGCGALVVMEKLLKELEQYQGEKKKSRPKSLNETLAQESKTSSISPSSSYEDYAATEDTAKALSGREEFGRPMTSKRSAMTASESSSKDDTSLAKSSGNSSTNTTPSGRATLVSSPNQQYYHQASDRTGPVLVSPSPGERKLVWVKFDKGSHLAYLLSVNGDTAKIRWESNKYEEEVSVDVLEEIETRGSPSERPKRTRNGNNNKASNSKGKFGSGMKNPKGRKSFQSPPKGRKSKMMRAN